MIKTNYSLEIKKIILSNFQDCDFSVIELMGELSKNFLQLYEISHQKSAIIEAAAQYIIAYIQLGFSYSEHKELFDTILQIAQFSPNEINDLQHSNPPINLNKTQLRSIIGRWPLSLNNSHTITDAINDIISHVENNEYGSYEYYTAKKDGTYTALYQLTVSSDYAIFHDVFKNKFYNLIKK